MQYNLGEKLSIIGKVDTLNIGNTFKNVSVLNEEKKVINIKLEHIEFKSLEIGKLYVFHVLVEARSDGELILQAETYQRVEEVLDTDKIHALYEFFYTYAPIPLKSIKAEIEDYLERIKSESLKTLTRYLYEQYKDKFYTAEVLENSIYIYIYKALNHKQ